MVIGLNGFEVRQMQPLSEEALEQLLRFWRCEHPIDLGLESFALVELT